MADRDSFALACAENNVQVNRPVEPPSLPAWEMGTVNIFSLQCFTSSTASTEVWDAFQFRFSSMNAI